MTAELSPGAPSAGASGRCLRIVGRWGGAERCGLAWDHDVHDPLGARRGHVPFPLEVHPFDGFPPALDEDVPLVFAGDVGALIGDVPASPNGMQR